MVNEEEKDDFNDEDDLFSNPDEQDYQFDQDEDETTAQAADEYDLDDDDEEDEDDETETGSFIDQLKQQIGQIIKMLREEDPRKLLIPAAIAIFSFVIIVYGFIKFIGLFSSSARIPQGQGHTSTIQTQKSPISKDPALPIIIQPPQQVVDDGSITDAPISADSVDSRQKTDDDKSVTAKTAEYETNDEQSADMTTPLSGSQSHNLAQKTVAMQSALDSRLATVENNYNDVMNQLNQLGQQAAQNSAQMNNVSQNIQMLESQMMKLNNVLLDLLSEAKKKQNVELQQQAERSHYAGAKREDTPELVYYIQAIIPGRAWLKDSNGKIFTVTTGDQIPGYGRIIDIDPKNGLVKTDQGRAIEYGIDQF